MQRKRKKIRNFAAYEYENIHRKEKRENDGLCHSSLLVSINIINENRMPMK